MSTCIANINSILAAGGVPLLPVLFNNTINLIGFTSSLNGVYYLNAPQFQSTTFNLQVVPIGVSIVNYTVSIYRLSADYSSVISLGTVTITDLVGSFGKDLTVGEYLFCFRTTAGSYTGSVTPVVVDYPLSAIFQPNFYTGSSFQVSLTNVRPVVPCTQVIYYELTDGSLPPGLTMDGLGKIYGQLPNLDCVSDDDGLSPSANWYWIDQDGNGQLWGRQWRFKVKAWVDTSTDSIVEDWFCVSVANNWDYDRDNFLAQDLVQTLTITTPVESKKLPTQISCGPCETPPEPGLIAVQPLPDTLCVDCVEAIELPLEAQHIQSSNEAIQFFLDNQDITLCCAAVNTFIAALKVSPVFLQLLAQSGFGVPSTAVVAAAQVVANQLVLTQFVNGRSTTDLDFLMMQWRDAANQVLPTTAVAWSGQSMQVTM